MDGIRLRTSTSHLSTEEKARSAMYALIVLAVFAVILGVASQLGWSVDSRDGGDWKATAEGARTPSSHS
jgi:hypothetical protein